MRLILPSVLLAYGGLHLVAAVVSAGWVEIDNPAPALVDTGGLAAVATGGGLVCAGVLAARVPRVWWIVGLPAVLASGTLAVATGSMHVPGTIVQAGLLVLAGHGLACEGPWSLRNRYREGVRRRTEGGPPPSASRDEDAHRVTPQEGRAPGAPVSEQDLAILPGAVAAYLRAVGAVGRPVPAHVRVSLAGRIRSGQKGPWMPFTAEQHNFFDSPARYFVMKARKGGVPVDVLHLYAHGTAWMGARLLGLVPVLDARGPDMDRSETVTYFNDLALFAPAALLTARVRWEEPSERSVRGHLTVGAQIVSALFVFGEDGLLTDFVSDDRARASADGARFTKTRWSTPLSEYQWIRGLRVPARGVGLWHTAEEPFAYFDTQITDLDHGLPSTAPPPSTTGSLPYDRARSHHGGNR